MKNKRKSFLMKTGSFSLEITIVFPFIILIILIYIWQMSILRAENILKSTIIKETEKYTFVEILSSYSNSIINEFFKENITIDDESNEIINSINETVLKSCINNSISSIQKTNKTLQRVITSHYEDLEYDIFSNSFILTCYYDISTPFISMNKSFSVPLRLWSKGDGSGAIENEINNIWQYDNFERGIYIRKKFGGNLPIGFPFLSGFSNNQALLIRSMDLTKETWQNSLLLQEEMYRNIANLKNYYGTLIPWGSKQIMIRSDEIQSRNIKFIVPENINWNNFTETFNNVKNNALSCGIKCEIIAFQKSIE